MSGIHLLTEKKIMDEWITHFTEYREWSPIYLIFTHIKNMRFIFFCGGDCKYLINNRIYELQPGDIILLDGMTLHKTEPEAGVPIQEVCFIFHRRGCPRVISTALGIPNLLDPFKKLNNPFLRTRYDEDGQYVDGRIKKIVSVVGSEIDEELQRQVKKMNY